MKPHVYCVLAMSAIITTATSLAISAEMNCPGASGIARTECLTAQLQSSESDLRQTYLRMLASVDASSYVPRDKRIEWKKQIKAAHNAWLQYRDIECKAIVPFLWWGGSGTGGAVVDCLLIKTKSRIAELRDAYRIK